MHLSRCLLVALVPAGSTQAQTPRALLAPDSLVVEGLTVSATWPRETDRERFDWIALIPVGVRTALVSSYCFNTAKFTCVLL